MFLSKVASVLMRNTKIIIPNLPSVSRTYSQYPTNIYEPDYLDCFLPPLPIHNDIIVQMKGYDFAILENYQRYIHKFAEVLAVDVDDGWGLPMQKLTVQRYKPFSTIVDSEYTLQIYERNIRFTGVPSLTLPTLLRVIQEIAPEGVSVNVHKSEPADDEIRFVPDNQLLALKQTLTEMGGPRDKKKKR